MEGLREVKAKLGVYLHPSRSSNVKQGVYEILNALLLRYNETFEGMVLAYVDPRILGHTANILEGLNPYFHVHLTATLLLFAPKVGMTVEGKVNKVEKDYLGVVVLGLFNAAIGVSDIREDLYYEELELQGRGKHILIKSSDPVYIWHCYTSLMGLGLGGTRAWLSESDERHCLKVGSMIRFSVKSVQETEDIIDLCGALQGAHTGCVKWLAGDVESEERGKHGSPHSRLMENGEKKHKRSKEERELEATEGTGELTPRKRKKDKGEAGTDKSYKKRKTP